MLFGGKGHHYLVLNKISTLWFNFLDLFTKSKWIKQYFPLYFLLLMSNLLMIGERPNNRNIESLDLKQKVNLLRLWRAWKLTFATSLKFYNCSLKSKKLCFYKVYFLTYHRHSRQKMVSEKNVG